MTTRPSQTADHCLSDTETKARLAGILDTAPALISLHEGEGHRISYCNALHDHLPGPDDRLGKPLAEALPEFATPEIRAQFDRVLATGEAAETTELPVQIATVPGGPPRTRHFRQVLQAHRDESGRITGVMRFAFDITDEVTARHEADGARHRLQTLQDSLAAFVGMLTPDGTLTEANETALSAAGLAHGDVIGKKFWDAYWWNWSEASSARLKAAIMEAARGKTVRYDAEVRVAGGAHIVIDFQLVPVIEADGTVSSIIPSAIDITQRLAAEDRLREALAEHQAFFDNSPVGLAMLDLDRRWIRVNPAFAALFGISAADHIGKRPNEVVPDGVFHPDPVHEILRTGKPIIGYEVRTPTPAFPGEYRDLVHNFFPIEVGGELRAVGKSVQDVTERKAAEERQALLIAELQHRVKNTLATVQSVARFTARHSADKQAMVASLQDRLAAIARTHDALTRDNWGGQWLTTLIRNEVTPYDSKRAGRLRIAGADVLLSPAQAVSFGLALHELATNAVKYGALSVDEGQLEIEITAGRRGRLSRLVWQERNGPPVQAPEREGFGSFLLDKVLGAELGATVTSHFEETGLRVVVDIADSQS